ncbi:Ger(x)C family spore germination protein [Paenibacillus albus]|uniref:Ger(X)C family spore germination protein n=1 Tax=Paenibacillus albus TaxID=2495582 RepID=A0A3Q8X5T9_9BACL|nr:Ger(x)C family spore germination protein [Paenibacillus albus]AZN41191.1 Ger(x)C family spore germination protein [Paenibacillus albus]
MRRTVGVVILFVCASLTLTGCWDVKTISDYNFVTALGIDYTDGKYKLFAELMDFSVIGKQDQGKASPTQEIWVGKSEGDTVYEALNELYKTNQQSLYWDHLLAIVISDRALKNDFNVYMDAIPRYPQIRYTSWVFGTTEPIDKLFEHSTFINFSPLSNLLHNPKLLHHQLSIIPPVRLYQVLANRNEQGETDLIPALSIDTKAWEDEKKAQQVLYMNGAYALYQGKAPNRFTESQLDGVKWTQSDLFRSVLPIVRKEKKIGMIALTNPGKKIHVAMKNGKPEITLHLSFSGIVEEMVVRSSISDFQAIAEQEISEQVMASYRTGIKKRVDLLDLQQYLYRYHNREWKERSQSGKGFLLTEDSLKNVHVKVKFVHSGMYDMTP